VDRVRHLLIVEDDPELSSVLVQAMTPYVDAVHTAGTLAAAREILRALPIDGMLLDLCLPDGQSVTLLDDIREKKPFPHVVALSGSALPEETFRMAQAGVRAFVAKPVSLARLVALWQQTLAEPPGIEPFVRGSVGRVSMMNVESSVREAMVGEALARAKGSVRGAARLLQISRQLLQHIVRGK
jgi:two-component system, response regulator RegA